MRYAALPARRVVARLGIRIRSVEIERLCLYTPVVQTGFYKSPPGGKIPTWQTDSQTMESNFKCVCCKLKLRFLQRLKVVIVQRCCKQLLLMAYKPI